MAHFALADRHLGLQMAWVGTGGQRERNSMDILYVGITVLFFAVTWGLVKLCERLQEL
jgi:hypothetical protein